MITASSSLTDVAFAVCTALDRAGYTTVLTGGSAATFHEHPKSMFPLEFPPGPLAIGEDLVTTWSTVKRKREVLHVLSPTDSCRDRLASYLFWNDFSGLEQALAVQRACAGEVDLKVVRAWCRREGHAQKYDLFASRLP